MATLAALVAMAHMQVDVALCAQETALIMMALQLAEDAQQAYTMEAQLVDAPTHHRLVVAATLHLMAAAVVATLHHMVAVTVATPHQVAVQEVAVATQVVVAAVADSLAAVTVAAVVASVAAVAAAATAVAAVTAVVDNIAHERAKS